MSHEGVLRAAVNGDHAALETLLRAYHQRVHRFALHACRDDFDAHDAVQEAFIKLSKRPDVIAAPSALSWLMRVVRNTCRRLLRPFAQQRARLGDPVDDESLVPSELASPELALERFRLIQAVHAAISALAPPQREVLVLRDLEGLSGEEVCAALSIGDAAMKSRLHRARQEVRAALLKAGYGEATRRRAPPHA